MWELILATVTIGAVIYKLFLSGSKDIWKENGIKEIDISKVVSTLDTLLGRKSMGDADDYAYKEMGSDKFCGIKESGTPVLIVKDMELIKNILVRDFNHFVDRRPIFTDDDGFLKKMLFSLDGEEWKGVRSAVSPAFAGGKVRRMMDSFNSVGQQWVEEFVQRSKSSANGSIDVDVVKSINLFTLEVISTTVFGMNVGVMKDPDSMFAKMADRFSDFSGNVLFILKFTIRMMFPWISKFVRMSVVDKVSMDFFEGILNQALKSRLRGDTYRNDFLQLLVEAKNAELKNVELDKSKKSYLTLEMLNAQSIQFFFDGFSTTGNLIAFVLFSLALYPEVQDKLREEVNKIAKEDGNFDYDELGQLAYLEKVLCEVLRKFPGVTRLERVCTKDYKDPESGLKIPKGTIVGVPVNSIHNDREYYDNPEAFDPEHFAPEKKGARTNYAYLPFGTGPRVCLGMRFAQIEVKSAIAHMIRNFVIEPTPKTPTTLKCAVISFIVVPPENLELRLTPIKK